MKLIQFTEREQMRILLRIRFDMNSSGNDPETILRGRISDALPFESLRSKDEVRYSSSMISLLFFVSRSLMHVS